jgi:hypothetical protein
MSEGTDPALELKDFTMQACYNSGFGELIDEVTKDQELLTFKDKVEIPIPPELIQEGDLALNITPEVQKTIDNYSTAINDPNTAFEYPFLITGKQDSSNELTKFVPLHTDKTRLRNEELRMQDYSQELYNEVKKSKDTNHDLLILGHTHPRPTEQNNRELLTNKINPTLKERFHIKQLGLNLSIKDLYQLAYFEEAVKGTAQEGTKVMSAVTMYNGDTAYVYIEDGKFKKAKTTEKGGTTAPPS